MSIRVERLKTDVYETIHGEEGNLVRTEPRSACGPGAFFYAMAATDSAPIEYKVTDLEEAFICSFKRV